jgi:hypothetical protein
MDTIWNWLEKFVPTMEGFPRGLLDTKNAAWFVSSYVIELVFFVLMPAIVYEWFYAVMPFSGVRGGISVALLLVLFGMTPFAILMMFRVKIPVIYILYQMVGMVIKLSGALAIIGYLYSL